MISQTPELTTTIGFNPTVFSELPFASVDRNVTELLSLAETVAKSKASILVLGDAGTGKRALAQYIHGKSSRAQYVSTIIQCRDFNETESFEKKLTDANGSTVILVEVSQLSFRLQGVLLSCLGRGLDIRLIATSSRLLSQLVKNGEFKEELFLRLNVVNLKVPNLGERLVDVEPLAKSFIRKFADAHGKSDVVLSEEAVLLLNSYAWPGNIKELQGVCERAVLIAHGSIIRSKDIQFQNVAEFAIAADQTIWRPGKTLDEIERVVILEALRHFCGNRTHAAKALGISIRTLRNKLAEYRMMGIKA